MSGIASVLPCKPMNASMHEHTMQDTGIQDKSFSESYLNSVGWRQSACHTRGLGESAPLSRSYAAQKQNPPFSVHVYTPECGDSVYVSLSVPAHCSVLSKSGFLRRRSSRFQANVINGERGCWRRSRVRARGLGGVRRVSFSIAYTDMKRIPPPPPFYSTPLPLRSFLRRCWRVGSPPTLVKPQPI